MGCGEIHEVALDCTVLKRRNVVGLSDTNRIRSVMLINQLSELLIEKDGHSVKDQDSLLWVYIAEIVTHSTV